MGTLIDNGMDIARIDFSWGDQSLWVKTLEKFRTCMKSRQHKDIAVIMDTKGIEIKTSLTRDHKVIQLFTDQELEICNDPNYESDERKFGCSLSTIGQSVSPGDIVILDKDLGAKAKVTDCKDNSITVQLMQDCLLGERKHMHLCGAYIDTPSICEQDEKDILDFAVKHKVDAIAISYTRSPTDIEQARAILRKAKSSHILVFAKIESFYALRKFEEILNVADGIIINRLNLGFEFPPSKMFYLYKWMAERAHAETKPIFFQHSILNSMVVSDEPTRYEVGDLVNMVEDGVDGIILTEEIYKGRFADHVLKSLIQIIDETESLRDWEHFRQDKQYYLPESIESSGDNVAKSAFKTAMDMKVDHIVVLTETGRMPKQIAKYGMKQPIISCSLEKYLPRQMLFKSGLNPVSVKKANGEISQLQHTMDQLKKKKLLKVGERIVVVQVINEERHDQNEILKILNVQ